MRMMKPLTIVAAAAAALVATAVAEAACTISTTPVSFGTYNVFAASPGDATGLISFRCPPPRVPLVTIQLDKGGSPTFNPRQMRMGSATLDYNLYLDSTRSTIWGDGTGGTQTFIEINPSAGNREINVFGRIPAGQDVAAGSYTATVVATILW